MGRKQDYDDEKIEWLTRFEKRFGVNQTRQSLDKMQVARSLFFDELGYSLTRRQFEALQEVSNERKQAEIMADARAYQGRQYKDKKTGQLVYQIVYRDSKGHFTKSPH